MKNYSKRMIDEQNLSVKSSARLFASLINRIFDNQKSILNQNIKFISSFVLSVFRNEKKELKMNGNVIQYSTSTFIQSQNNTLKQSIDNLENLNKKSILNEQRNLIDLKKSIKLNVLSVISDAQKNIEFTQNKLHLLEPSNVLKRGFSITRLKGKALHNTEILKNGDVIETELLEGVIKSCIENTKNK